jgi:hypothetical protein
MDEVKKIYDTHKYEKSIEKIKDMQKYVVDPDNFTEFIAKNSDEYKIFGDCVMVAFHILENIKRLLQDKVNGFYIEGNFKKKDGGSENHMIPCLIHEDRPCSLFILDVTRQMFLELIIGRPENTKENFEFLWVCNEKNAFIQIYSEVKNLKFETGKFNFFNLNLYDENGKKNLQKKIKDQYTKLFLDKDNLNQEVKFPALSDKFKIQLVGGKEKYSKNKSFDQTVEEVYKFKIVNDSTLKNFTDSHKINDIDPLLEAYKVSIKKKIEICKNEFTITNFLFDITTTTNLDNTKRIIQNFEELVEKEQNIEIFQTSLEKFSQKFFPWSL